MLRAFWTWDPVSSGIYKTFDEPYAYTNNRWFFDKSVWQKMFRTMGGCGFNAMVLANTHPFPFMIDLSAYPEAKVIDETALYDYQRMHQWIFETALEYGIAPYLQFFNIYYPAPMLESRGIDPKNMSTPTDLAVEYTHHCTRKLLETYHDLAGIIADAGENVTSMREEFLQQAIVDAVDAARPDAALYLRGWGGEPNQFIEKIKRRNNRPIKYSVKYTFDHLVDSSADPSFNSWVDTVGGENVTAEFWISNFEPWTSFSFETVEGILENLNLLGCDGFSLQPLSLYEWPCTSDTYFKYQWQRDRVWYHTWGGTPISELISEGQPKWLLRNAKLVTGFEAASKILELLALYLAGNKQSNWRPQFCSIAENDINIPHLLSIEDMLSLESQEIFSGRKWWEEVTGDKVVHPAEYIKSGTPVDAYGPEEFIEELIDLSEQAIAAGEKGMRSASGEKELPSFSRDAQCMGKLGEFYVERFKAALSHARGENAEALEHITRALDSYRNISSIDSPHRTQPFAVRVGQSTVLLSWPDILQALEAELEDATKGEFKQGIEYPIQTEE